MRLAYLLVVLVSVVGCNSEPEKPQKPEKPEKPSDCPLVCPQDFATCPTSPGSGMSQECQELCYWGECCYLQNGVWQRVIVDCEEGAAVDAALDGAADA